MIIGVDHALIAVDDLESAMAAYGALGFHVMRGGAHPQHGTHNALVPLSDGFYLELMGVRDPSLASRHPHTDQVVQALGGGNRLALFALESDDLDADVEAIRERGLPMGDPVPGERERPDGERVAWRTAHPDDPRLPFLIEDVTPRSVRVPEAAEGIGTDLRLAAIDVTAQASSPFVERYAALLGQTSSRGAFSLSRGSVRVSTGDGEYERQKLVLSTGDIDELIDQWTGRDVSFRETHEDGQAMIMPRETAGVSWAVRQRPAD